MSIESREEAVNVLRGAAEHYESEHRWLHSEVREFLRARGDAGIAAGMDMAMAQEALDSFVLWLRKTADDLEDERSFCKHE